MSLEIAAACAGIACNDLQSLTGLCEVEASGHQDPRKSPELSTSASVPTRMKLNAHTASRLNQLRDTNLSPR